MDYVFDDFFKVISYTPLKVPTVSKIQSLSSDDKEKAYSVFRFSLFRQNCWTILRFFFHIVFLNATSIVRALAFFYIRFGERIVFCIWLGKTKFGSIQFYRLEYCLLYIILFMVIIFNFPYLELAKCFYWEFNIKYTRVDEYDTYCIWNFAILFYCKILYLFIC